MWLDLQDLCGGDLGALLLGKALSDGLDLGVGEQKRSVNHVVTESRVSSNVNALLLAVSNKLRLDKKRVTLNLVGSGGDTSALDKSLNVLLGVVRNTDSASLGLGKLSHGLPCVDDGDAVVNLNITLGLVLAGQREKVLADVLGASLEGDGEVDEVELQMLVCVTFCKSMTSAYVKVLETELLEAVVESGLNDLGVVLAASCENIVIIAYLRHLRVPELGGLCFC